MYRLRSISPVDRKDRVCHTIYTPRTARIYIKEDPAKGPQRVLEGIIKSAGCVINTNPSPSSSTAYIVASIEVNAFFAPKHSIIET